MYFPWKRKVIFSGIWEFNRRVSSIYLGFWWPSRHVAFGNPEVSSDIGGVLRGQEWQERMLLPKKSTGKSKSRVYNSHKFPQSKWQKDKDTDLFVGQKVSKMLGIHKMPVIHFVAQSNYGDNSRPPIFPKRPPPWGFIPREVHSIWPQSKKCFGLWTCVYLSAIYCQLADTRILPWIHPSDN